MNLRLRVLVVLIVPAIIMAAAGCTVGHKELVFDVQNTTGKGQTVVIEPARVSADSHGSFGEKIVGPTVSADIDKCIASAIKAQHPDSNIIFGKEPISGAVQVMNIRDFIARKGLATNFIMEFTADVIDRSGQRHTIKAEGGCGFLPGTGSRQESAEKACKNFVDQAKEWFKEIK